MGQEISQQKLFIDGLTETLKTQGVKVTEKQLTEFFNFIQEVCPQFPVEGTIDERCWKCVGDALRDYYQTFGPEKILVQLILIGD